MSGEILKKDFINQDGVNFSEHLKQAGLLPTRANIAILNDNYESEDSMETAIERTLQDVDMIVENIINPGSGPAFERSLREGEERRVDNLKFKLEQYIKNVKLSKNIKEQVRLDAPRGTLKKVYRDLKILATIGTIALATPEVVNFGIKAFTNIDNVIKIIINNINNYLKKSKDASEKTDTASGDGEPPKKPTKEDKFKPVIKELTEKIKEKKEDKEDEEDEKPDPPSPSPGGDDGGGGDDDDGDDDDGDDDDGDDHDGDDDDGDGDDIPDNNPDTTLNIINFFRDMTFKKAWGFALFILSMYYGNAPLSPAMLMSQLTKLGLKISQQTIKAIFSEKSVSIETFANELYKEIVSGNINQKNSAKLLAFTEMIKEVNFETFTPEQIKELQDKVPTFEIHAPGYTYMGPKTNFEKRVKGQLFDILPKNKLDYLTMRHDMYYQLKDPLAHMFSDELLLKDLQKRILTNVPIEQKILMIATRAIFLTKNNLERHSARYNVFGGFNEESNGIMGDAKYLANDVVGDKFEKIEKNWKEFETIMDNAGFSFGSVAGGEQTQVRSASKSKLSLSRKLYKNFLKDTTFLFKYPPPRDIKTNFTNEEFNKANEFVKTNMSNFDVLPKQILDENEDGDKGSVVMSNGSDFENFSNATNITTAMAPTRKDISNRIEGLIKTDQPVPEDLKQIVSEQGTKKQMIDLLKYMGVGGYSSNSATVKKLRDFYNSKIEISNKQVATIPETKPPTSKNFGTSKAPPTSENFGTSKSHLQSQVATIPETKPPTSENFFKRKTAEPTTQPTTTQAPTTQPTTGEPTAEPTAEPTTQAPTAAPTTAPTTGGIASDDAISKLTTGIENLIRVIAVDTSGISNTLGGPSADISDELGAFAPYLSAEMDNPDSNKTLSEDVIVSAEEQKESLVSYGIYDYVPTSLWRPVGGTFDQDRVMRNNLWAIAPLTIGNTNNAKLPWTKPPPSQYQVGKIIKRRREGANDRIYQNKQQGPRPRQFIDYSDIQNEKEFYANRSYNPDLYEGGFNSFNMYR